MKVEVNFSDLLKMIDVKKTAVISMNWDTVIESGVSSKQDILSFDYGFESAPLEWDQNSGELSTRRLPKGKVLHIVKPHGSINWLYCDCCRRSFWLDPSDYDVNAEIVVSDADWKRIDPDGTRASSNSVSRTCPDCDRDSLGMRLATFSYKKALDAPMHVGSWIAAEKHLRDATHWVFFGYSLPDADYEFKFMLKRIQLAKKSPPLITVITIAPKGEEKKDPTLMRFRGFFGPAGSSSLQKHFTTGLSDSAMRHLKKIGAIRPESE